jgi:hypothetical protein
VITPIETAAEFREEVRREKLQQKMEKHSPLLKSLGLAHYWQQLLDDGKFRSLTKIAAAEGMDVGRVSRMLRLAQLSPPITNAILAGKCGRMTFETALQKAIPCDWGIQHSADSGAHR